eukprot:CAMPEP_0202342274 /NCGR_PEP_ID=MMETSP1126-20121109/2907_1 /ASSEMBLY_ACC=CAM_ASM_000457 /TAXON_ID=3047 /ORGANISM="Dunaliella tertiolecta, Strain CCMP1320" /LENGTH=797 /DNA_ID=CAMNT_0048933203 /DNA_START=90 /DNA_END=2483 /DNA_ORIENTATION=+
MENVDGITRVQTPMFPCTELDVDATEGFHEDIASWGLPLANSFLEEEEPCDEDFQAMLASRAGAKSPASGMMRGSYSLNDLTLLQQQQAVPQPSSWNHKLVSVKPKLEPVPEGGPSLMGGPLNLMPLGCSQPNSQPTSAPANMGNKGQFYPSPRPGVMPTEAIGATQQQQQQKRQAAAAAPTATVTQGASGDSSDCVEAESTSSESIPRSYPSCNTLATQLQMTHVRSETQLSGLAEQQQQQQQRHSSMVPVQGLMGPGGAVQGSTAAAVEAFRQSCAIPYSMLQGDQQGDGESGMPGPCAPVRRGPSGLPLRKSQSAVELGSWRSFNSPEEYWDVGLMGEDGQMGQGGGAPDERLAKIQRYRERRVQRGQARVPNYQSARHKGGVVDGRLQQGGAMRSDTAPRRAPRSTSSSGLWGSSDGGAEGGACSAASIGVPDLQKQQQQQHQGTAGLSTQPLYAQAYNVPAPVGAPGSFGGMAGGVSYPPGLSLSGPATGPFMRPMQPTTSAMPQHQHLYPPSTDSNGPTDRARALQPFSSHLQQPFPSPLLPNHNTPHPQQHPQHSLFGSPQHHQIHQRMRCSQRSRSYQSLSPTPFIPPPPAPSNLKFSMVGGSCSPPGQLLQGQQGSPHLSPATSIRVGGCSPVSQDPQQRPTSLLPSVLAHPPRMLAPCLPPSHPWAGSCPNSGSIFAAGSLNQQVSPTAGSLHLASSLGLTGTPMQAPLANQPSSGQTIFSVGSTRLPSKQQQQQQQQQQAMPGASAMQLSATQDGLAFSAPAMTATAAAGAQGAQPMVIGEQGRES